MKFLWQIAAILILASACACNEDAKPLKPQQAADTVDINEPQDSTVPVSKFTDLDSNSIDSDERGPKQLQPNPPTAWENYSIKQGQHYNSLRTFSLFPHDSIAFEVVFDSTVIYQTQSPANQADWNKLIGFSDCGGHHHANSVRVVWRYLPASGGYQLGEYYYTNSTRSFSTLGNYQINDTIPVKIYIDNGFYRVQAGQKTGQKQRACNINLGRYALFPYFGGDETAPHDINIFIRQTYP